MCKKANLLYLILLIWSIAFSIVIGMTIDTSGWSMLTSTLVSYSVMLIPVIVYIIANRINPAKHFAFRVLKPVDIILSILFGYMLVPMMLFLNYVSMLVVQNHMTESSLEIMQYPLWLRLIIMSLLPGLIEEFMFRGVFFHSYRKNGILGAALVSGLLFGLLHMNFNQFLYAFALGIIFALLVEATSSIFASMLAHMAVNSYSVIMLELFSDSMLEEAAEAGTQSQEMLRQMGPLVNIISIIMLGLMAFGFGAVALVIFKKLARRNNRLEYIRHKIKQGVRPANSERFITVPLLLSVIIAVAMMIMAELRI